MDFEKLEDLATEVNMALNQNMRSIVKEVEEEILKRLIDNQ